MGIKSISNGEPPTRGTCDVVFASLADLDEPGGVEAVVAQLLGDDAEGSDDPDE